MTGSAEGREIIPVPARLAVLAALLAALAAAVPAPARASDASLPEEAQRGTPAAALSGPADGFARAIAPRPFEFPADHGAHRDFRTEWWYFTGNVADPGGQRFGFQLTFFRFALAPPGPERASAWATREVWMAHFALSDPRTARVQAFERFARGALGLAGVEADPLRVWLGDWEAAGVRGTTFPVRLRAQAEGRAIDLTLSVERGPVLQGEDGLSRKSDAPGNASYYYSYTRLAATGTLDAGDGERAVVGLAWLDREWSTSALADDQVGWDWFALQLSDGRDLVLGRLRRVDGSVDPASTGMLVGPGGERHAFGARDMRLEPLRHWPSPRSGARYPVRWRLAVPRIGVDVTVEPLMDDQELDLAYRYWEGAVRATGSGPDGPVDGRGYLEMTGYDAARRD